MEEYQVTMLILLHYDSLWYTGQLSSNANTCMHAAVAGYNLGNSTHHKMLPNSGTNQVVDWSSTTNADETGIWIYPRKQLH